MNPMHSRLTPEHYTPAWLVAAANRILGGIHLDPASCEVAQRVVAADRYFSLDERGENGLTEDWGPAKTVLCNPPGSLNGKVVKEFWAKAWNEHQENGRTCMSIHFSLEQMLSLSKLDTAPSPLTLPCHIPVKRVSYDTLGRSDIMTDGEVISLQARAKQEAGKGAAADVIAGIYHRLLSRGRADGTLIRVPGKNPTHGSFVSLMSRDPEIHGRFHAEMARACEAEQGFAGEHTPGATLRLMNGRYRSMVRARIS